MIVPIFRRSRVPSSAPPSPAPPSPAQACGTVGALIRVDLGALPRTTAGDAGLGLHASVVWRGDGSTGDLAW
ncbi:hypothetical protein ACBI99_22435 [Nonomuraea sp. ATR24]|uniref:hypothetical protein n=1 Tax=Nonomuraea TaxID=83681 RepID=UPI001C5DFBC9|nr:hypothetical protein [Nonomuraea ceibae]